MSDWDLIQQYKDGDLGAIEVLLKKYMQSIFNVCMRICEDYDDAHDVTQEVCMKIMKSLHSFEGKSALGSWIHRIAYIESLQYLKKKKQYVDLEDVSYSLWVLDDHDFDKQDAVTQVQQVLSKLDPQDRLMILLFYYDERKIREIADIMEINENTIKTRLSRTKTFLKAHLEHLWDSSFNIITPTFQ